MTKILDWLTIGFFDENSKVIYPSLVNFDINNPNFSINPFQPDTSDGGRISLNLKSLKDKAILDIILQTKFFTLAGHDSQNQYSYKKYQYVNHEYDINHNFLLITVSKSDE